FSAAKSIDFDPETEAVRTGDWKVAEAREALKDRRVEITGPASPAKMAINALNSGAKVWLADMEDASSPTWQNVIKNQVNLIRVLDQELDFTAPDGREYKLNTYDLKQLPTIVVRPRGWHLPEKHLLVAGTPVSGALVDFGLHFFHNAKRLLAAGRG
ncbi:malate synthase A, partial [Escherichia coli]|nr:malate synthase A [Escherichia coli]